MTIDENRAAALQNTKLLAATIQELDQLRPTDQHEALAGCVPAISQFATSLTGTRRDKISAWASLDLALQNRMKPGDVRAVALALTGRARRITMSEGRFEHGQRTGFDQTVLAAAT